MIEAKWISLNQMTAHPSSNRLDGVYFYPQNEPSPLRIWLYTAARTPGLAFSDTIHLSPQADMIDAENKHRWVDMGICTLFDPGRHSVFGLFLISGMSLQEAASSVLLIQPRVDWVPSENLAATQESLWGIAREDAGRTSIDPKEVKAGEPVEFRLSYRCGRLPLPEGSKIRFFIPALMDFPQDCDPEKGGYFSGRIESGEVQRFTVEAFSRSEESHEKNLVTAVLAQGMRPGEELMVVYRTTKNYICPVVLDESEHLCWYSALPPLRVEISVGGTNPFIGLSAGNSHQFRVVAGPHIGLRLYLPSRRRAPGSGENPLQISLRGVFVDRFGNPAPFTITLPRFSFPQFSLRLERDGQEIDIGKRMLTDDCFRKDRTGFVLAIPLNEPGVYRVEAFCSNTKRSLAVSNPLELTDPSLGVADIYWGEIHAHTSYSDGVGDLETLYKHAYDTGCLDFAACSDHACYFSDNQWEEIQDSANKAYRPGEFVTLIGYEWGGYSFHRNFYTSRDKMKLFRGIYQPELREVLRYFDGDDQVVAGPHGLVSHGLKWEDHDPATERFVEIYSMWGSGDGADRTLYPVEVNENNAMTVSDLLKKGAILGFTGGGDCHHGVCGFSCSDPAGQGILSHTIYQRLKFACGLTAAMMTFPDRRQLIESLRNRKTYATTGDRILLSFSVSGSDMGDCAQAEQAIIECTVRGCDDIKEIKIIKDGDVAEAISFDVKRKDVELQWEDKSFDDGTHSYFVKVIQQNGHTAWSSPVWIKKI